MEPGLRFADLLRQLRTEARLTQEELAEQAGLSPRSVSDLERGINRTARKDSALMLASALKLTGPVQEAFVAAARGRAESARVLAVRSEAAPESSAAAAARTLPRDIGGFTGRERELTGLEKSLAKVVGGGLVGIYAIDGMAGIGKTTFAVHAAHRLAGRFPDGQFFLPLHAHTAGQSPVDPADALASLLMTAGVAVQHIPPGLEARAAKWRDHVAGKKILLLLDDVAGHEQVRPLLPGSAASLVLVTSRRRLTALEDAIVISIDTLSPDEAWALLVRLADRADLELDRGRRPGDHPAVRVPAAGDRNACPAAQASPGQDCRRARGRAGRCARSPGGHARGEPVCSGGVRSVLSGPHGGSAKAVPAARPHAGTRHRRVRGRRAGRHEPRGCPAPAGRVLRSSSAH